MNSLLDHEHEHEDDRLDDRASGDREISLGTTTLLGIFFALALLLAVFFGFGYSLGRKSVQGTSATPGTGNGAAAASSGGGAKPAPGKSTLDPVTSQSDTKLAPVQSVTVPYTPAEPSPTPPPPAEHNIISNPLPVPTSEATPVAPRPVAPAVAAPVPAAPVVAAPVTPGVTYMVQIAAVTHQEDADMLSSALKGKGYAVGVHTSTADKFMHVQVGPFNNKKDAEAMRQRLLADGFNAILK